MKTYSMYLTVEVVNCFVLEMISLKIQRYCFVAIFYVGQCIVAFSIKVSEANNLVFKSLTYSLEILFS